MPVRILILGLLLYAVVTISGLQSRIAEKRQQLETLTESVEEYQQSNELLREDLESGVSEEDISEIARTQLNYAEPGERVFVDTSSR